METEQLKKQWKSLLKKREEIEYRKKLINQDYEDVKNKTKTWGVLSLICIFLLSTVLRIFCSFGRRHVVWYSMGKFGSSIFMMVLVFTSIMFIVRGYEWFLNGDNRASKALAKKLERYTYWEKMNRIDSALVRLNIEIDKIENALYESGEIDYEPKADTQKMMHSSEQVERKIVERTIIEKVQPKKSENKAETKKDTKAYNMDMNFDLDDELDDDFLDYKDDKKAGDVDDILSALDFWDDEDEDEFESSSDMWNKDTKSKY